MPEAPVLGEVDPAAAPASALDFGYATEPWGRAATASIKEGVMASNIKAYPRNSMRQAQEPLDTSFRCSITRRTTVKDLIRNAKERAYVQQVGSALAEKGMQF
jgi:hypothetical protein